MTVTTRPSRDSYRHGNLRAEAIAVALDLVVAQGHEALSLRRVADAVGVAHRSLYNHFSDREGLLDAVAEEGFLRFGRLLRAARTPDEYVGTYVGFALGNPRLYDLMKSRPHATMKQKPTLQAAVHLGITEALRLFARPQNTSEENRRAVMKVMVLLHGGIALHRAGILDVPDDAGLIEELQAMIRAS
ncbi:MAG: TetR/AcrR family transcriptional regulator [Phenylobacterium sp.]|uniref:TetR/AcrR family transcriptional regulator n=1 Tax=Phenylobacterium sp. TaxID=1871053 RepID=UPI002735CE26|nr:TetR/AcrR family transcriptional regulator [Phenylobacterium sp.]MDP3749618.1 TetR/AcrR family transcriptional regulator [Phenylobacterium sp.]